ncbi:hypothetical protein ACLOJK_027735 [Asimina triloba]
MIRKQCLHRVCVGAWFSPERGGFQKSEFVPYSARPRRITSYVTLKTPLEVKTCSSSCWVHQRIVKYQGDICPLWNTVWCTARAQQQAKKRLFLISVSPSLFCSSNPQTLPSQQRFSSANALKPQQNLVSVASLSFQGLRLIQIALSSPRVPRSETVRSEMDARDSSSSSSAAGPGTARDEEDGHLSAAAALAKDAALFFQSRRYTECLDVLHQLLEKKEDDPKASLLSPFPRLIFYGRVTCERKRLLWFFRRLFAAEDLTRVML